MTSRPPPRGHHLRRLAAHRRPGPLRPVRHGDVPGPGQGGHQVRWLLGVPARGRGRHWRTTPTSLEAAVVGLPDDEARRGARRRRCGCAPAPGRPASSCVVWAACAWRSTRHHAAVVVVDDLPRTGTRKVQRDRLLPLFVQARPVSGRIDGRPRRAPLFVRRRAMRGCRPATPAGPVVSATPSTAGPWRRCSSLERRVGRGAVPRPTRPDHDGAPPTGAAGAARA